VTASDLDPAVLATDQELTDLGSGGVGTDHLTRLLAAMREWCREGES
jgi:hypothetical protein